MAKTKIPGHTTKQASLHDTINMREVQRYLISNLVLTLRVQFAVVLTDCRLCGSFEVASCSINFVKS